jgi:hypothetical protein
MRLPGIYLIFFLFSGTFSPAQNLYSISSEPNPNATVAVYKSQLNSQLDQYLVPWQKRNLLQGQDKNKSPRPEIKTSGSIIDFILDEDQVYVLEEKEKEASVYDIRSGRQIHRIGSQAKEKIKKPVGLALLPNNQVAILDESKNTLYIFDRKGNPISMVVLSGIVAASGIYSTKHGIFIYDSKVDAISKFAFDGKPSGANMRLYVDAQLPDDKKGKIGGLAVDALGWLWIWNRSKHQLQVYSWVDKPALLFTTSEKEGLYLSGAEAFSLHTGIYEVQIHDKSKTKGFLIKVPVKNPANLFGFDIDKENLVVNIRSDDSHLASHYGLLTQDKNGTDSLAYVNDGKSFLIQEQTIYKDQSRRYRLVAMNPSQQSQPTSGFDNFFGWGNFLRKENKPSEAFNAYQNALRYMGRPSRMVQFVALAMVDMGKDLIAQNIELIKGLNVLKTAYNLSPREPAVQRGLSQGFSNLFWRLAAQENYQAIIDESSKVVSQTFLKPYILQSVDSISGVLDKLNTIGSLTNARLLRAALIEWAPEHLPT